MSTVQFAFGRLDAGYPAFYFTSTTVEAEDGSSAAVTTASAGAGQNVCRVVSDTACYISFGTAPNASSDAGRLYLPANAIEYFRVNEGHKGACVDA